MELKFAPVFLGYTYSLDVTTDQLSSFNTVKKERVFKVFTALVQRDDLNILQAISCLGQDKVPSPQLKRFLEKLVLKLYISKRKELKERYSELKEIGLLRWELPRMVLPFPQHQQP